MVPCRAGFRLARGHDTNPPRLARLDFLRIVFWFVFVFRLFKRIFHTHAPSVIFLRKCHLPPGGRLGGAFGFFKDRFFGLFLFSACLSGFSKRRVRFGERRIRFFLTRHPEGGAKPRIEVLRVERRRQSRTANKQNQREQPLGCLRQGSTSTCYCPAIEKVLYLIWNEYQQTVPLPQPDNGDCL